jgi:cell division protein FtsQ
VSGGRQSSLRARAASRRAPIGRRLRTGSGPRRGLLGAIGRYRPRPLLIASVLAILLALGGGWLWFRDSSLVAVRRVEVTGASGPDASKIRSSLIIAARNMTTMDANVGQLRSAVEPYPDVKSLKASTQFPHGMRIQVIEQVPVAVVVEASQRVAVAGDGTLLPDVRVRTSLPSISLSVPPGGRRLTGYALSEVQLLAAAPYQMLAEIDGVTDGAAHGLVAQLRNGPNIYFGDSSQLSTKWTAASAVLADSGSDGAPYIDVTDPNRPAAGAGSDTNSTGAASAGSDTNSGAVSGSTGG